MFLNNTRTTGYGGALSVSYVDVELRGSLFINNTAESGGAVGMKSCFAVIRNTRFLNNYATQSGGALYQDYSYSPIHDNCFIRSNTARSLGGNTRLLGGANYSAGAIGIYSDYADIDSCQFESNYADNRGGAIYLFDIISYLSNCSFYLNKAGGAIYFQRTHRADFDYVNMTGGNATMNSATNGGFLYSLRWTFAIQGTYCIVGNKATKNGGAIFTRDSSILLPDRAELSFVKNTAEDSGGAIYAENSHIDVTSFIGEMWFCHNAAAVKGGAM